MAQQRITSDEALNSTRNFKYFLIIQKKTLSCFLNIFKKKKEMMTTEKKRNFI
jgi:hypothetical protein